MSVGLSFAVAELADLQTLGNARPNLACFQDAAGPRWRKPRLLALRLRPIGGQALYIRARMFARSTMSPRTRDR